MALSPISIPQPSESDVARKIRQAEIAAAAADRAIDALVVGLLAVETASGDPRRADVAVMDTYRLIVPVLVRPRWRFDSNARAEAVLRAVPPALQGSPWARDAIRLMPLVLARLDRVFETMMVVVDPDTGRKIAVTREDVAS